jgi:5-methylcytosine-specific restriction protein A
MAGRPQTRRALSPCTCPGCTHCGTRCPTLTRTNRCEPCRLNAQRHSDSTRPTARQRGYNTQWQTTRSTYLATHPWCQWPGCTAQATDVDHIDGHGPNGPRGHDHTNLRGYCHSHHSQRTAQDQPGGWNATHHQQQTD